MQQVSHWHQTRLGLLISGLVELGVAYGFAALSIDRGNLWWYLLTLIFLAGALRNFFNLIRNLFHGRRQTAKTGRH